MGLQRCTDMSAADWIADSGTPWERLVTLGPDDFPAHARLRFIPDPTAPGQSETDVTLPDDHLRDLAQAVQVLHRLWRFTATPQDCYFCLWDGYAGQLHGVAAGALVSVPRGTISREFALFRGQVTDIDEWETLLGTQGGNLPPAIVWPADHAWCFASDVDPHFAGIAASRAAVDALVADPVLDVVRVQPGEGVPTYY